MGNSARWERSQGQPPGSPRAPLAGTLGLLALIVACTARPPAGELQARWVEPVAAGHVSPELRESHHLRLPAPGADSGAGEAGGPVHRGRPAVALEPLPDGSLEVVRAEGPRGRHSLLRLAGGADRAAGEPWAEWSLPDLPPQAVGILRWQRLEGGAWLVAASGVRAGDPPGLWRLEPQTEGAGEADEGQEPVVLPSPGHGGLLDLASAPDGGFFLLDGGGAARFNRDGSELWRRALPAQHASLALAPTSRERLAVLGADERLVFLEAATGAPAGELDLRSLLPRGEGLEMPTGLVAAPAGGLLVRQYATDHPLPRAANRPRAERTSSALLLHLDASDRLHARYPAQGEASARFADLAQSARLDGAARPIARDAGGLYHLTPEGGALRFAGEGPPRGLLIDPRANAFGPDGSVAVQDGVSAEVHRFDGRGERSALYVPDESDFARPDLVELAPRPDGGLALRRAVHRPDWLAFDADGRREALHDGDPPAAFAASGAALLRRGHGLALALPGRAPRVLERRPDGGEVRIAHAVAFAPDGSFIFIDVAPQVLDGCECFEPVDPTSIPGHEDTGTYLAWYGPEGDPRRSFRIPRDLSAWHLALGDGWALLATQSGHAELLDLETGELWQLDVPRPAADAVRWSFALGGAELVRFEARARRLAYFPLPGRGDAAFVRSAR